MSTVCTTTLLGRLVDLDVFDDQVASIKTFGIGVRLCVFEEAEEKLGGFLGPPRFGDTEVFACSGSNISTTLSRYRYSSQTPPTILLKNHVLSTSYFQTMHL